MQVNFAEPKTAAVNIFHEAVHVYKMAYPSTWLPDQASSVPLSPAFQFIIFESPFPNFRTFRTLELRTLNVATWMARRHGRANKDQPFSCC